MLNLMKAVYYFHDSSYSVFTVLISPADVGGGL
jgi:hypothetical protein